MVTVKNISGGHVVYCLSTDRASLENKARNGDIVVEMDTSKCYFWDAEHSRWLQTTLPIAI